MSTNVIKEIVHLLQRYGDKNYGEPCSQLTHCLSCAWHAQQDSAKPSLVVAAFLHDIGHFIADHQQLAGLDKYGHFQHAEIGANWLAKHGFPASVYQPIRYHVLAKRYLMTKSTRSSLSNASTYTLQQQGGDLTQLERQRFEQNNYFTQAINLRQYDDLGKPTASISFKITPWLTLIEQVLAENHT